MAQFTQSILAQILYGVIVFIVPAYRTFQSFTSSNVDEEKLWLKYWLFMLAIIKLEDLMSQIIEMPPGWFYIKITVLSIFVFYYPTKFGEAYDNYAEPIYTRYTNVVFKYLNKGYETATKTSEQIQKKIIEIAEEKEKV